MTATLLASLVCDAPVRGGCGHFTIAEDDAWSFDRLADEAGYIYVEGIGWLCHLHGDEHQRGVEFSERYQDPCDGGDQPSRRDPRDHF